VPAFWAGDQTWRVRFAPPERGTYRWVTSCSDATNPDLHGIEGELVVVPYDGAHPLLRHGPLRVSDDARHLQWADGTPFFWLGDTWSWMFRKAISFPDDFELLSADRAHKGFNVVLTGPGLNGGMAWPDPRSENEAGPPFDATFEHLNPAYFDMADLRIQALVRRGIIPCVVGSWGFYEQRMGEKRLRRYWRHLVARWGAYPVVWCLAGEAMLPFESYDPEKPGEVFHDLIAFLGADEVARRKRVWAELGRMVREIDPHGRLITIHPTSPNSSREQLDDPSVLDLVMLQTGHLDRESIPNTVEKMVAAVAVEPRRPVLNGEVAFEGILQMNREEIQRFMFWASVLSGGCGHTYGAIGVVLGNTRAQPYGPAVHGFSYGDQPWEDDIKLPGATQLGLARRLLERYEWWRFEPHPEWVDPHWSKDDYLCCYAAGIPGEVRFVFMPFGMHWRRKGFVLAGLEPGKTYRTRYVDPVDGTEHPRGPITGDADGRAQAEGPPVFQDWLLVLESDAARVTAVTAA
jgi:hypothetical protein